MIVGINKDPTLQRVLRRMFPDFFANIDRNLCPTCSQPIGEFKDELSKQEYSISGMCQECQDATFGENHGGILDYTNAD